MLDFGMKSTYRASRLGKADWDSVQKLSAEYQRCVVTHPLVAKEHGGSHDLDKSGRDATLKPHFAFPHTFET